MQKLNEAVELGGKSRSHRVFTATYSRDLLPLMHPQYQTQIVIKPSRFVKKVRLKSWHPVRCKILTQHASSIFADVMDLFLDGRLKSYQLDSRSGQIW